jgi:hypothetical protein
MILNINQIIKKFAHSPKDTDDLVFIKGLILRVSLTCSICGLLWSLLYFKIFGLGITAFLPLIFIAIVGSAILISHRLADHRPLVYVQLISITWISALIQWSIGSMDHSGLVIA